MRSSQVARLFLFVKESPLGSNKGRWVEAIQRLGNAYQIGKDPWCACFVTMVLDIVYQGRNPLPATAGCDVLLEAARKKGLLRDTPEVDDVGLRLKSPTDADHAVIVTAVRPGEFDEISGNTNDEGAREGYEVAESPKPHKLTPGRWVFIRLPKVPA
jgi:hypothetical protein